jgi:diadenosine tetraphosphate (Ap4A) HIT family hydrolase
MEKSSDQIPKPMQTAIHKRLELIKSGNDCTLIARVHSGYWVMGDIQIRLGYSLLIPDPVVSDLNALSPANRDLFLSDWGLLSQITQSALGALRVNMAIFGNVEPALHAHLIPRFSDEPDAQLTLQPWALDWDKAERFDLVKHQSYLHSLQSYALNEYPARVFTI